MYTSRDAYADAYRRGVDELVAAGGLRPADYSAGRTFPASPIFSSEIRLPDRSWAS